jgi:lysophospholipase L1-like esterase
MAHPVAGCFRHRVIKRILLLLVALATVAVAAPAKWAKDVDKFIAADAITPPPRDAVVFIGSSSIVKWKSLATDFPGVKVINRGFGGSELADSVFYLDRIAIPYHPRVIVLYAGDNDLEAKKTPETVAADFEAFCAKVHGALPATRVIFIGIKPSPSRWKIHEQMEKANALIAAFCAKDPRRVFVDVWRPMLDAKGQPRPELFVADKLHMNPAGYAIWTPLVAPHLQP